ncbi:MAG: hemolysin III family protein [Clostridia bacterium]|nr:hemolysin III family protein [Clostridia bacterium]
MNYTKREEQLNTATHIFGAILAVVASVLCVQRAILLNRMDYLAIGLIYCLSMLIVFVCSSIYHGLPLCKAKKVMRVVDYTAIYFMLMGTITPYMLLSVAVINHTLGWALFLICLVATVVSIILTLTAFSKTKAIRMVLYIVIGFCAFSSLFVIGDKVDPVGVKYVLAGNGTYIIGLILFAIGAKKKYFHTIFHIFVMLGATIHFINLYKFVFV